MMLGVVSRSRSIVRGLLALDAALLLLAGIAFLSSMGMSMAGPILPLYAIHLGATPVQLGLMTSAFAAANALAQIAVGLFVDRAGARGFIRAGMAAFVAGSLLTATAANAVMVIVYRSVTGLGSGANLIATRVYIAQTADPARLAYVNGILSAAGSTGLLFGPALGGAVAEFSDLSVPFLVVAAFGAVGLLGALYLPSPKARIVSPADASPGHTLTTAINRSIVVLLFAQLFQQAVLGTFMTVYAPFATQILGWSIAEVVTIYIAFGMGNIVIGPWMSHLADRTGRRRIAVIGCLLLGLFGLVHALEAPRLIILPVVFLSGGGMTAFMASWFALVSAASPSGRQGRTLGLVSAISNVGTIGGAMISSALWETYGLSVAIMFVTVASLLTAVTLLALRVPARGTGHAPPHAVSE
ncbi:MAG TPA: MFS transporter [Chloroflexota bacterium]|nr:MFS transporter [Chloroflexota bacterium]